MCGIAGSVNFKLPYDEIRSAMGHRGPDGNGAFTHSNIDFFHLRLAILDIESGAQPMTLDDRYTIIFNGEIYNHQELRVRFGLQSKTHSDTEILLLLFRDLGPSLLQHLDGMFVFAIYDHLERKIFLARDRAGKKPLYLFQDGSRIVFASELNALKRILPLQLAQENLLHYFRFGTFYKKLTPYEQVQEMPAGSYCEIDCTRLTIQTTRWWKIEDFYRQPASVSLPEALELTDSKLRQSVHRRMEASDLEVGAFLSGGIDSGLVTAIASEYTSQLKTFTVSFSGEFDEAPLAELVARRYNTSHTSVSLSFDNLINDVEGILMNYGEPFYDSSAIPSFYVSREARKHLTVILNGDGADELFGGYRRYVPFSKFDFFNANAPLHFLSSAISEILPSPASKKSKYNYFYRLIQLASKKEVDLFLSAGSDIFEGYQHYINDSGIDYMNPVRQELSSIFDSSLSGLQKIMLLDFDVTLFSDFLVKMDIATMANSLEGRSPFLSKEMLEWAPTLPDNMKIRGGDTKFILRKLAANYLPSTLIHQPKRGFEVPLKHWVNNELRPIISDYLNSPTAFHSNLLNPTFTRKLLDNKVRIPAEKRAKIIWTIFCMEVWYQRVFLRN